MAIGTPTLLRAAAASTATVTTASFTPTAGALLKVDYGCRCVGSIPGASTISGGGLIWAPVYEDIRDPGGAGNRIRLSAWTAAATGAPMTVTCGASGSNRSSVAVTEITGAQIRQPAGTDTNGAGHPAPALASASQPGSALLAAIACTGAAITPPSGFTELSETLAGTDFVLETAWDTGVAVSSIIWPTVTGNQGCVGAILELEPSTAASVGGFTESMALSDSVGDPIVNVFVGFTEAATTGDSVGSLGTSSNTSPENPAGVWAAAAASWKLPGGADSKGINNLMASGITATTLNGPAGTFAASSYARRAVPTFTALSAFSVETWVQSTAFGRIFRIGSTTVATATRAELRTNSDGSYTLTRTVGAVTQASSTAAGVATAAAQHVMAVFPSGANHLLYINGAAVTLTHAGAAVTGAIAISSTDEAAIGNPSPPGLAGMAGKIGRVTLWPFAASATRAATSYRHQSEPPRWIGMSGEDQAGETNRAPVAVPFRYTALPGVAKTINVRARAYDPDGDTPSIVSGSLVPSTGTASISGGDIVATAPASFTGEQTVQFDLRDTAGKTSRAKVYGTVRAAATRRSGMPWSTGTALNENVNQVAAFEQFRGSTPIDFTITYSGGPFWGKDSKTRKATANLQWDVMLGSSKEKPGGVINEFMDKGINVVHCLAMLVEQERGEFRMIANGGRNSEHTTLAGRLASWLNGKPVNYPKLYLCFAQEVNIADSYPWAWTQNKNASTDYINAYRRVAQIYIDALGDRVKITWNTLRKSGNVAPVFPGKRGVGDGVVDLVTLDCYDNGYDNSYFTDSKAAGVANWINGKYNGDQGWEGIRPCMQWATERGMKFGVQEWAPSRKRNLKSPSDADYIDPAVRNPNNRWYMEGMRDFFATNAASLEFEIEFNQILEDHLIQPESTFLPQPSRAYRALWRTSPLPKPPGDNPWPA